MLNFLLFCILAFFCWPLALAAVILFPLVWLILLPFRLVGIVVGGTFELIAALFSLPGRMLRAI
jgi:hypothetical protein